MALSPNINNLEKDKFFEDTDGNTAVRTSAKGEFSVQGLKTAGKITIVSINDSTWTEIPATALVSRNAMCIQNSTATEIKINYDNATVGYVGIIIGAYGERYYDISDDISIYAKSSSGTINITVEEIS